MKEALDVHSRTLDGGVGVYQTNVGVCRFLSTSTDNQLDEQDKVELGSEMEAGLGAGWKAAAASLGREMGTTHPIIV